jgi:hypothetical protein
MTVTGSGFERTTASTLLSWSPELHVSGLTSLMERLLERLCNHMERERSLAKPKVFQRFHVATRPVSEAS